MTRLQHLKRRSERRLRNTLGALALLGSAACASKADTLSQAAVEALERCDIRTAHRKFAEARAADGEHPEAALGFALTDVALLIEAEPVQNVLRDIGFNAPFDAEKVIYGTEGLLARAARHDSCESIDDFLRQAVAYPPLYDDTIEPLSLLTPGLTLEALLTQARALDQRLAEETAALIVAAENLEGAVTFEAGACGLGSLTLSAPELYLLAGVIEITRATTQLADAYDWAIPVELLLNTDDANLETLAAVLNQHLGRVADAPAAALAEERARQALTLLTRAMTSGKGVTNKPAGALIDWSAVPAPMYDDAERLVSSLAGALSAPTLLADMTPALSANFGLLFTSPIDFTTLGVPLFSVNVDELGEKTLQLADDRLKTAFDTLMSPAPSTIAELNWTPSDRWSEFDFDSVIDPERRFEDALSCTPDDAPTINVPAPTSP